MSKKLYNLVVGVVGGVAAIASAVVVYFDPSYCEAIVASIGIASTATAEIASLFLKKE